MFLPRHVGVGIGGYMNWLFEAIAPRTWRDGLLKVLLVCAAIAAVNVGYVHTFGGFHGHSATYFALNGAVVGSPFVTFFFWASAMQVKLQQRLSYLSRKDGLTKLNNRRTFMELANKRMIASPTGVLLLLDADRFKRINDKFGHSVGDICLKAIGGRLLHNMREIDVAGRLGGEEFAVLLAEATINEARVICERIGYPIPYSAGPENEHLTVTLSIGAIELEAEMTLDQLLVRADEALYLAKNRGRAQTIFWDPEMESDDLSAA